METNTLHIDLLVLCVGCPYAVTYRNIQILDPTAQPGSLAKVNEFRVYTRNRELVKCQDTESVTIYDRQLPDLVTSR